MHYTRRPLSLNAFEIDQQACQLTWGWGEDAIYLNRHGIMCHCPAKLRHRAFHITLFWMPVDIAEGPRAGERAVVLTGQQGEVCRRLVKVRG